MVVQGGEVYKTLTGGDHPTTNNRMELTAVIESIRWARKREFKIISDSRYCVDGVNGWMLDWQRNGWKNSVGEMIKNHDLWLQAFELVTKLEQRFRIHWVKGHSTDTGKHSSFNALADSLAKEQSSL